MVLDIVAEMMGWSQPDPAVPRWRCRTRPTAHVKPWLLRRWAEWGIA